MVDRTTKLLLAAVALGLWANAVTDWLHPAPVFAEDVAAAEATSPEASSPEASLPEASLQDDESIRNIERYLMHIYRGSCLNDVIC